MDYSAPCQPIEIPPTITPHLKFVAEANGDGCRLKQLWINGDGSEDWRDLEIEYLKGDESK